MVFQGDNSTHILNPVIGLTMKEVPFSMADQFKKTYLIILITIGNKMPTQSIAKSHTCLSSEVEPINSSMQNKISNKTAKELVCVINSIAVKTRKSFLKQGVGAKKKFFPLSHAGGGPTGT
jgi:hypothetical protein